MTLSRNKSYWKETDILESIALTSSTIQASMIKRHVKNVVSGFILVPMLAQDAVQYMSSSPL